MPNLNQFYKYKLVLFTSRYIFVRIYLRQVDYIAVCNDVGGGCLACETSVVKKIGFVTEGSDW